MGVNIAWTQPYVFNLRTIPQYLMYDSLVIGNPAYSLVFSNFFYLISPSLMLGKCCKCLWAIFLFYFLKMVQPRPLFCLFSLFSITISQKNCRPQWDSNLDRRSRRRARWPLDHHHGPLHHLMLLDLGSYLGSWAHSRPQIWLIVPNHFALWR